jgi:hypothetical protein
MLFLSKNGQHICSVYLLKLRKSDLACPHTASHVLISDCVKCDVCCSEVLPSCVVPDETLRENISWM